MSPIPSIDPKNHSVDHGSLPAWKEGDLPEPLPMNPLNWVRTIGPGAILLAGSIGGGEWIVGPLTAVHYGTEILWVATVGILLQMIFNLEAIRYTLYTGEPIMTGIMRLSPGSRFWGVFYILFGAAQLATPALALGCANVLFAAASGREAHSEDGRSLLYIAYGVLGFAVLLLLCGKSIERMLERLSWIMVIFIFAFLIAANLLFVPLEIWKRTAFGFLTPHSIPENMDWLLLGVFAATAGSGGIGNMAISNWSRDKGLGMGKWVGSIGGLLAHGESELEPIGRIFKPDAENQRKWKVWWKYSVLDQTCIWAAGCIIGMFLNVNLALAIVPANTDVSGYAAGAFQARYMAEQLWSGFWVLCLLNGFWILFSTQLGNMDCLTRVVCDILWSGEPKVRSITSRKLYAGLLLLFTTWGLFSLGIGESALSLFKILGIVAGPILAIASFQVLRVNLRFLPKEIQPPLWRRIALVVCGLFFGAITLSALFRL